MSVLNETLSRFSEWLDLTRGVVVVLAAMFSALLVGTIVRLTHLHALPEDTARALVVRLRTWWIIAGVLALVVLLGRPATVILMALVSVQALREYFRLAPEGQRYGAIAWWAYAAAILQYLWIYLDLLTLSIIFIPVVMFLLLTLSVVLTRRPEGFMHTVGTLQWGMMMLVFCLSHVALLLTIPDDRNPAGGAIGLFLYLILLTEFNDIAQALWGRSLGRRRIVPRVSPGKTWEGLIGALICTVLLAILLAPLLTPLAGHSPWFDVQSAGLLSNHSPWAAIAGLMIGVAGFFGDITFSAVKRDAHVKDSGDLLPGQGGILDRIDSLTFTAPLFFHSIYLLYVA